ncbi:MAG TPA: J domain-containing protein [Kofleriaceae bacterium]|nr:J domain-containing protein [Kofleriaceae bacterium]
MATGRTLHVRCTTWEQVEVFHARKVRRGKMLAMKVPFEAALGAPVTLGLELPNQVVIAIDGVVRKASAVDGEHKTWIEIELVGFTEELVARIKSLTAAASTPAEIVEPPPAPPERPSRVLAMMNELPADERELFLHLTNELKRLRQAAVHEVLGVERDADAATVRAGWMNLMRRHHPDLVVRRKAPAITHLAEELTILANRAYDRLRAALVAEGRATAVGSSVASPPGWLVGFDDISSGLEARKPRAQGSKPPEPPPAQPMAATGAQGDAFESRAREMLLLGDHDNAQEVLAAALVVYPRSRPLRSLYYVASALGALGKGEKMLATTQLETALAHYDQCVEASRLLDHLRRHETADPETLRRLFR